MCNDMNNKSAVSFARTIHTDVTPSSRRNTRPAPDWNFLSLSRRNGARFSTYWTRTYLRDVVEACRELWPLSLRETAIGHFALAGQQRMIYQYLHACRRKRRCTRTVTRADSARLTRSRQVDDRRAKGAILTHSAMMETLDPGMQSA